MRDVRILPKPVENSYTTPCGSPFFQKGSSFATTGNTGKRTSIREILIGESTNVCCVNPIARWDKTTSQSGRPASSRRSTVLLSGVSVNRWLVFPVAIGLSLKTNRQKKDELTLKSWHSHIRAYSKLVWSHKGNQVATNGSALLLVGVPTPDQFSNWSKTCRLISDESLVRQSPVMVTRCWRVYEKIRFLHGHFGKGARRADGSNAALVAVFAQAASHLQKERTVAEGLAALDALAATDALVFVDVVLEIRVFDVLANNRVSRASQIFAGRVEACTVVMVITTAKQTIAARFVLMHALDRRPRQDALGLTPPALDALVRVDLPEVLRSFPRAQPGNARYQPAQQQPPCQVFQKIASFHFVSFTSFAMLLQLPTAGLFLPRKARKFTEKSRIRMMKYNLNDFFFFQ